MRAGDAGRTAGWAQRIGLWLLVLVPTAWRSYEVFRAPRLVFEEGKDYFRAALSAPWWEALVRPHFDYLALVPNLGCTLAAQVPLEHAPRVTAAMGLGVQLLLCALVIHGRIFGPPGRRGAATRALALVLLLGAMGKASLWATTWAAQYLLALAVTLVLIEPGSVLRGVGLRWRALVVGLGGLTGLLCLPLVPLFGLRAWWERSRGHAVLTAVLASCALLQAALYVGRYDETGGAVSEAAAMRGGSREARAVLEVPTVRLLLRPVVGKETAAAWARAGDTGEGLDRTLLVGLLGTGFLLAWAIAMIRRDRLAVLPWLALAGQLALVFYAAIGVRRELFREDLVNPRYFVLPGYLVLVLALRSARLWTGWVTRTVIGLFLATAVWQAGRSFLFDAYRVPGDPWAVEARAFEAEEQHYLRIWTPDWYCIPAHRDGSAFAALPLDALAPGWTPPAGGIDLRIVTTPTGFRAVLEAPPGARVAAGAVHVLPRRLASPPSAPVPRLSFDWPARIFAQRIEGLVMPPAGVLEIPLDPDSMRPGVVCQARLMDREEDAWSRAWILTIPGP